MRYTLCENDGAGGSRVVDVTVEQTEAAVVAGEGPLRVSVPVAAESVTFVEIPESVEESGWHNAPCRQFVVVLGGRLETETTDGELRTFGPGDVALAADVDGRGHRARIIEGPLRALFVALPAAGASPEQRSGDRPWRSAERNMARGAAGRRG